MDRVLNYHLQFAIYTLFELFVKFNLRKWVVPPLSGGRWVGSRLSGAYLKDD